LVIGSHRRSGIGRMLLGSVAEGLLRTVEIPVVVAHEDDETRTGPVLVAIDRSPAAQAALQEGSAIARARGNVLALVHIVEETPSDASQSDAVLEEAAELGRGQGLKVVCSLRRGDSGDEILAAADDVKSWMIVMGTHGRSLVPRFVLGSVAAAVVQRARVPVATIRRPGRARSGQAAS
jgi:nucleotide-binding universal stress UspA family protein